MEDSYNVPAATSQNTASSKFKAIIQKTKSKLNKLKERKNSKIIVSVSVALLVIFLCCCMASVFSIAGRRGSGNIVSSIREVDNFSEVVADGNFNLFFTKGEKEAVTIEAEDNIISKIETKTDGEQLKVYYKSSFPYIFGGMVFPTEDINVYITVKNLNEITVSGSANIENDKQLALEKLKITIDGSGKVNMNLKTGEFETSISGSGEVNLKGETTNQILNISGSGNYHSKDFVSKNTEISCEGSCNVIVNASEKLDIEISGSGDVKYLGNPKVNQEISGSGNVQQYK